MAKKYLSMIITLTIVLALAGCGKKAPESSEEPVAEESATEEDGQNPVMNFIGVYSNDDHTEALVEAEEMENAKITVTYAGSPWFQNQTVMSGHFDTETLTMEFDNATLTEYTYGSDGSVTEETVSYTDGTGKAVFHQDDSTLTITEHFQSGDSETVFNWGPSSDMKKVTDPAHYASVTAMDKFKVETEVAFAVRTAYLDENWGAIADMIRYPIKINGSELADADAFLKFMENKNVREIDHQAMMDETTIDMFVNGEGICMGDGEVWLSDPNYKTNKDPKLEIIAINGIEGTEPETIAAEGVETEEKEESKAESSEESKAESKEESKSESDNKSGAEAPEEQEFDRDFYAGAHIRVYEENGTEHILYEGSDGYWREENGTTYVRLSRTEYQLRGGSLVLKTLSELADDEFERDFYDTASVKVYDENYNEFILYESDDGYWREENGQTYIKKSDSEYQRTENGKSYFVH